MSRATGMVCEQRTSLNFEINFSEALILSAKHAPPFCSNVFFKQLQTILIYPLASGALCAMLRMEIKELRSKI